MSEVKELVAGYKEFYQKYFVANNDLYKTLSKGQSPKTLVIACSDSRIDPAIITNAKPGDIFVIRNVANIVPPCDKENSDFHGVSAALEFAVNFVKVNNIIILGHSNCAGITALLNTEDIDQTDFIGKWVNIAIAAKDKTLQHKDNHQHICEKESIILSLNNLMSFSWIKEGVENNNLKLHGWHFSIQDGSLQEYDGKDWKSLT